MPGTHGSLTKAGKVRNVTPKVEKHGVNAHPKKIPRIRFRKNYQKRVMQNQYAGQPNSISAQKFNRGKQTRKIESLFPTKEQKLTHFFRSLFNHINYKN